MTEAEIRDLIADNLPLTGVGVITPEKHREVENGIIDFCVAEIQRRIVVQRVGKRYDPVAMVFTSNVSLSGIQSVDGVSGGVNKRVLLSGQNDSSQNGPWIMKAGAWQRGTDLDSSAKGAMGAILVEGGTLYGLSVWLLDVPYIDFVLGVTDVNVYFLNKLNNVGTVTKAKVSLTVTETDVENETDKELAHSLGTSDVVVKVYDNTRNEVPILVVGTSSTTVTVRSDVAFSGFAVIERADV